MKFLIPVAVIALIAIVTNSIVSSASSPQAEFKGTIERRIDTSEIE